uniref:Uncharacterized protein n=1 Tax=Anguilla anguilla TaxID=7936 RepID=A0A0E9XXG0_ANGAN
MYKSIISSQQWHGLMGELWFRHVLNTLFSIIYLLVPMQHWLYLYLLLIDLAKQ